MVRSVPSFPPGVGGGGVSSSHGNRYASTSTTSPCRSNGGNSNTSSPLTAHDENDFSKGNLRPQQQRVPQPVDPASSGGIGYHQSMVVATSSSTGGKSHSATSSTRKDTPLNDNHNTTGNKTPSSVVSSDISDCNPNKSSPGVVHVLVGGTTTAPASSPLQSKALAPSFATPTNNNSNNNIMMTVSSRSPPQQTQQTAPVDVLEYSNNNNNNGRSSSVTPRKRDDASSSTKQDDALVPLYKNSESESSAMPPVRGTKPTSESGRARGATPPRPNMQGLAQATSSSTTSISRSNNNTTRNNNSSNNSAAAVTGTADVNASSPTSLTMPDSPVLVATTNSPTTGTSAGTAQPLQQPPAQAATTTTSSSSRRSSSHRRSTSPNRIPRVPNKQSSSGAATPAADGTSSQNSSPRRFSTNSNSNNNNHNNSNSNKDHHSQASSGGGSMSKRSSTNSWHNWRSGGGGGDQHHSNSHHRHSSSHHSSSHHHNSNSNSSHHSGSNRGPSITGGGGDPADHEQTLFEQRLCEDAYGVAVRKINQNGKPNLRYVKCVYVMESDVDTIGNDSHYGYPSSTLSNVSSLARSFRNSKTSSPLAATAGGSCSNNENRLRVLTWGKKKDVKLPLERFVCVRKGKTTDRARRNPSPSCRILSLITTDPNHQSLDIEAPTRLDRDKFARAFARFLDVPLVGEDQTAQSVSPTDYHHHSYSSFKNIKTSSTTAMSEPDLATTPKQAILEAKRMKQLHLQQQQQQHHQHYQHQRYHHGTAPLPVVMANSSSSNHHRKNKKTKNHLPMSSNKQSSSSSSPSQQQQLQHPEQVPSNTAGGGRNSMRNASASGSINNNSSGGGPVNGVVDVISSSNSNSNAHPNLPQQQHNGNSPHHPYNAHQQQKVQIASLPSSLRDSERSSTQAATASRPTTNADQEGANVEDAASQVSSLTGAGFDQEIVEELHQALTELRAELEESRAEAARAVKVAEQAIQSAENSNSNDWNSTVTHKAAEAAALAQKKSAEAMAKQRLAEERLEGERRTAAFWRRQAEAAEEEAGTLQTRAAAAEVQRAAMAEELESERRKNAAMMQSLQQSRSQDHSVVPADQTNAAENEETLPPASGHRRKFSISSRKKRHGDENDHKLEVRESASADSGNFSASDARDQVSDPQFDAQAEIALLREKLALESAARRKLLHEVQDLRGVVRVYCRPRESPPAVKGMLSIPSQETLLLHPYEDEPPVSFKFDRVFTPDIGQREVYDEIEELCLSVMDGYNICLLAHGQRHTGKTYSMLGNVNYSQEGGSNQQRVEITDHGIHLRTVQQLFTISEHRSERYQDTFTLEIVEVHNERLLDLLTGTELGETRGNVVMEDPKMRLKRGMSEDGSAGGPPQLSNSHSVSSKQGSTMTRLEIRTNHNGDTVVQGLLSVEVKSYDEVYQLWQQCLSQRASRLAEQGADLTEYEASSHVIATLSVVSVNAATGMGSVGKLKFVDLAGADLVQRRGSHADPKLCLTPESNAEKGGSSSNNDWKYSNRSLATLNDVVNCRSQYMRSVPYRNSTLTHLLRDNLEADTKVLLLLCVSAHPKDLQETACALRFASGMRRVTIGKATKHTLSR